MSEYIGRENLAYLIQRFKDEIQEKIDNMNNEQNYIETSTKLCPYRKNYYAKNTYHSEVCFEKATHIEAQFQYCLGEKCMKYDVENDKCGRD